MIFVMFLVQIVPLLHPEGYAFFTILLIKAIDIVQKTLKISSKTFLSADCF